MSERAYDLIQKWLDSGASRSEYVSADDYCLRLDAARATQASLPQLPEGIYWRCTNRRGEPNDLQICRSRNHADGTTELGLSVALHLGYAAAGGYRYAYQLRGQVVGTGSDGEPVIDPATANVIGRVLTTREALDHDDLPARKAVRIREIAAATGATTEQINYLACLGLD